MLSLDSQLVARVSKSYLQFAGFQLVTKAFWDNFQLFVFEDKAGLSSQFFIIKLFPPSKSLMTTAVRLYRLGDPRHTTAKGASKALAALSVSDVGGNTADKAGSEESIIGIPIVSLSFGSLL